MPEIVYIAKKLNIKKEMISLQNNLQEEEEKKEEIYSTTHRMAVMVWQSNKYKCKGRAEEPKKQQTCSYCSYLAK